MAGTIGERSDAVLRTAAGERSDAVLRTAAASEATPFFERLRASEAAPFFEAAMPGHDKSGVNGYAGFAAYVGLATVYSPTRAHCDVKPCFSFQSCT